MGNGPGRSEEMGPQPENEQGRLERAEDSHSSMTPTWVVLGVLSALTLGIALFIIVRFAI